MLPGADDSAGFFTTGLSLTSGSFIRFSTAPDDSIEPDASSPVITFFFAFEEAAFPLSHSPSPDEGPAAPSENCL